MFEMMRCDILCKSCLVNKPEMLCAWVRVYRGRYIAITMTSLGAESMKSALISAEESREGSVALTLLKVREIGGKFVTAML